MLHIEFWKLGLENPEVNAWFAGMYRSFFQALERTGAKVTLGNLAPTGEADVLVVPLGKRQGLSAAQAMSSFQGPVVLYVPPGLAWFRQSFLARWREYVLFAYGADFAQLTPSLYSTVGIEYHCLPFASDPAVMRPLDLAKSYDVVFVGNPASGTGRRKYIAALLEAAGERNIQLIGPGWDRYGYPFQCIAWGDLLNQIYNTAHVCVNLLNDNQKLGAQSRLDANNRLFDLAMAGCFQVCNAPQVVRRYFGDTEVPAFDDPAEWVSAILYYLDHPTETQTYRLAARRKAMSEHTWDHRASTFLELVESTLNAWKWEPHTTPFWVSAARYFDRSLPVYGAARMMHRIGTKLLGQVRRLSQ
jgi:glycosyltransferase involved in cell wall biosynthesis